MLPTLLFVVSQDSPIYFAVTVFLDLVISTKSLCELTHPNTHSYTKGYRILRENLAGEDWTLGSLSIKIIKWEEGDEMEEYNSHPVCWSDQRFWLTNL